MYIAVCVVYILYSIFTYMLQYNDVCYFYDNVFLPIPL